jgi:hypothetical protein
MIPSGGVGHVQRQPAAWRDDASQLVESPLSADLVGRGGVVSGRSIPADGSIISRTVTLLKAPNNAWAMLR